MEKKGKREREMERIGRAGGREGSGGNLGDELVFLQHNTQLFLKALVLSLISTWSLNLEMISVSSKDTCW